MAVGDVVTQDAQPAIVVVKRDDLPSPQHAPKTDDSHDIGGKKQDAALLQTNPKVGLTSSEVEQRLLQHGYNEIVEIKPSQLKKFLSYFTGSISYLIEVAIILSGVLEDWVDFGIILGLLVINAVIGFLEEARAESAIDALRKNLALRSKCIRNGVMEDLASRDLVPGDIISLRLGDVVPADCQLLGISATGEETLMELSIDQAALTGESLPVSKHKGDQCFSSSVVKQGQSLAVVTFTGEHTFIGRAAHLMSITTDSGHFQKVITKIGNFLIGITLVLVFIILMVAVGKHKNFLEELKYALLLTIASIPVGLPTVLSVTMAVGAKQLAAKQVIVKRLTAVEELAGVSILCSDKTGTLTLNELTLDEPHLAPGHTNDDLLLACYLSSEAGARDPIELCVRESAVKVVPALSGVDTNSNVVPGYRVHEFTPFDPISKLTKAKVERISDGAMYWVAKGAPQVILRLASPHDDPQVHVTAENSIKDMAASGLRALGVARSLPLADKDDTNIRWQLSGLLSLLDPPRHDSGPTIQGCKRYGLSVKMVTGDALLIAKEVALRLGMSQNILHPGALRVDETANKAEEEKRIAQLCVECDGFAQVVPEDKFRVVELLQGDGHLVAMTGDGVNDAPALKKANVGIAVHGCTDAARSAADIVLLAPGLSAIVDGIITSRKIFQRMRSYAIYRITSTIHFLIFLFFSITVLEFAIPGPLIVMIALLNDAATIAISIDNAMVSPRPDKWKLGQLLTLSFVLGVCLSAASFAHYFISRDVFDMNEDQLGSIMYLHMSSCPHFVIFSTRLSVPFYRQMPSGLFLVAVFATQIFAMFICAYGVIAEPIGWAWSCAIMGISLTYFLVLDAVKCAMYKYWGEGDAVDEAVMRRIAPEESGPVHIHVEAANGHAHAHAHAHGQAAAPAAAH